MLKRFISFIFILGLALSQVHCAEFNEVFNPSGAKTSRSASKKTKKKVKELNVEDLPPGTRHPIKTRRGTYYFVATGDTLSKISQHYKYSVEELAHINHLDAEKLVVGSRLFIPKKRYAKKYNLLDGVIKKEASKRKSTKANLRFIWPVKTKSVSSKLGRRWGRNHDGIDIRAPKNTPIYAAESGEVVHSGWMRGYGRIMIVRHKGNYFTAYAHMNKVYVKKDDKVKRGQKIAAVGKTGKVTGYHLHFEVHHGTKLIDPLSVLPK